MKYVRGCNKALLDLLQVVEKSTQSKEQLISGNHPKSIQFSVTLFSIILDED